MPEIANLRIHRHLRDGSHHQAALPGNHADPVGTGILRCIGESEGGRTDRLRQILDRRPRPHRPTRDPHLTRRRRGPIYLDKGLTCTNRERPGLNQALAAVRAGDTLVVPKLDRLARSVPDARDIGDTLVTRGVRLSLGGNIYDPADPMSKMFFNMPGEAVNMTGDPR
jgi:hypothetical protein